MESAAYRLKLLRKRLKLTQRKFGELLGLAWYQIKDMETGKVKVSPVVARLLTHEVGVRLKWLLNGEGRMFKDDSIS
jgi:transcriptional regulator with XRE-family HTH domain